MRHALLAVALLTACGSSAKHVAGPPTPESVPASAETVAEIDAIARDALKDGRLAAVSIAIWRGDRTTFAKAYGDADTKAHTAATADTVFRIGSVTKQFTAAAIMQLVEQGKIGLDDPLTKYLPDYPMQGKTVSIRRLLTHTSGIYNYTDEAFMKSAAKDLSLAELIALFSGKPFDFEPGARWSYSNSNYVLLGAIIEKVTGMSYAAYLKQNVFPRARLASTTYCDNADPRVAHGYSLASGALADSEPISMTTPYAAGALCSTARDLVAWTRALHAGEVVSDASYQQMITPVTLTDGTTHPYGFALAMGDAQGHKRIGHNGGINGFASVLTYYPDDDLVIAVLVNTESGAAESVEERVARVMLGLPEPTNADLPVSAADQAKYVGVYDFKEIETKITVAVKDGKLVTQVAGQPEIGMTSQGGDVFHIAGHDEIVLTFHITGDHADSLTISQGGMTFTGAIVP